MKKAKLKSWHKSLHELAEADDDEFIAEETLKPDVLVVYSHILFPWPCVSWLLTHARSGFFALIGCVDVASHIPIPWPFMSWFLQIIGQGLFDLFWHVMSLNCHALTCYEVIHTDLFLRNYVIFKKKKDVFQM